MVGIFSRFSVGRNGHRRAQSALNEREVLPPNPQVTGAVTATATHGIEVAVEFKPVEHPIEPLDNDRPIQCPLPEPSILNDGRLWKERVSAGMRRRPDLPVMKEGGVTLESEAVGTKPRPTQSNRLILPSLSAPEHNLLNLLEECNASGI
ncbi:Cystic fibrosis transmembrane conductance regulator [Melia azedarach]|uniref:Cystic fibrosis transmembrane conductance regulator n=1 Tax=Melia azedarach TaxID=155640 RepID=A0ACC1YZF9_MELAZ|nr:Cystic fibrosis transmembrane conductance regulator [Melia azedarach]